MAVLLALSSKDFWREFQFTAAKIITEIGIDSFRTALSRIQLVVERIDCSTQFLNLLPMSVLQGQFDSGVQYAERRSLESDTRSNQETGMVDLASRGSVAAANSSGSSRDLMLGVYIMHQNVLTPSNQDYPDTDRELISIHMRRRRPTARACELTCICVCHRQTSFGLPYPLTRIFGSEFVGYSGLPVSFKCNEQSCRRQAHSSVILTYSFPLWFLSRAMLLNFNYHSIAGFNVNLKVSRTIPDTHHVWYWIKEGNTRRVQNLFTERTFYPWDSSNDGNSILLV